MGKKINASWPSNGVYGEDGVFYPNGSTPPEGAGTIDNPRAYAGGKEGEDAQVAQVVGAPTEEQQAEAERQAAAVAGPTDAGDEGGSDASGAKPAARKATAKKAAAKRAK